MGKVKAKALFGTQRVVNVEILDERIVVIVVFKIRYNPTVEHLYLFGIGITACTNFVSEFFYLRVPQGCTAVGEIRSLRFADEILCGEQRYGNKCRYCQHRNFRHETFLAGISDESTEIHHLEHERDNHWKSSSMRQFNV